MEKRILKLAIETLENRLAEVMLEREALVIILKEQIDRKATRPEAARRRRAGQARSERRAAKPKNRR